jgi:hypothetical protein
MKIFLYSIFLIFIFLFFGVIAYLSTVGLKTSKFNNLIIKEIVRIDPKADVRLNKIKIKFDIKKVQLFLSTKDPKIKYQGVIIPVTELKIYSKINKLLSSKIEVAQIIFAIENFKIQDMQKLAVRIKPSNFKTYLLNNIYDGEIEKSSFDLIIGEGFKLINYTANGKIKKTNLKIKDDFLIKDISFNFALDKNLTLINSIKATHKGVLVSNGSIDLQRKKNIVIKSKFNLKFDLNEDQMSSLFKKTKFLKDNKVKAQGSTLNEFDLRINNKFKIIDYNFKATGQVLQSRLILKNKFKNRFVKKNITEILIDKTKLKINFTKKNKNSIFFDGFYSTDNLNYKKFKIRKDLSKKKQTYLIDFNLSENFYFDIINFKTDTKKKTNIRSEFRVKNNKFFFKTIDITEGKSFISVKGLEVNEKKEIEKINSINLITFKNNKENNNFKINIKKKISITGDKYDSTNLIKSLSLNNKSNILKNFSNKIEIKLKNLTAKSEISLSNFNLIGSIEKGEINKISAKGDFSGDKYLDISLKKDQNNKKIIEIYSDQPQALIADYNFFEGVRGGKLLYRSVSDEDGSVSKLTIEKFKITKAPAFATLLTLADLSGFADLLAGEGMSFDFLEINTRDNNDVITVDEVLALGTSVSLTMNGYIEKKTGLVSLSGTLVPAKTLNNLVSKIPIVGNILVGTKTGEGVFGVSFKMKGLPGKIKTIVNPVKTLTPRFITRALEKRKKK